MVELFSVVALFIMFRETLEACVVVAVMLNLCNKLQLVRGKRQVWLGVIAGVLLSITLGVIFIIVFYVTKNSVFSGKGKAIFKGYVNMVASFLIAVLGFAMLRFMNYEKKWERKLRAAHQESQEKAKKTGKATNWALFLLCFSAVFREGVEAVVFLAGVSTTTNVTAIPIAAVVGIICGLACGFLLFYTGRQIQDMWWFFILSFILLYLIAAGLISTGVSAWQSIGWWGTFFPSSQRPWWNQPVWDTCRCCNDNITQNKFFGLVNAIFGYQCQPTFISLFSYCMFWIITMAAVIFKWRRGSLTDAEYKSKRRERKRRQKLGLPLEDPEEEAEINDDKVRNPKISEDSDEQHASTSSSDIDAVDKARLAASQADPFAVADKPTKNSELTPESFVKEPHL